MALKTLKKRRYRIVFIHTQQICAQCVISMLLQASFLIWGFAERKRRSTALHGWRKGEEEKSALLKYAPPELPASSAVLVFTRNISSVHYTLLRPPAGQQTFPSLLAVTNSALDHSRLADPKPQRRYATYLLFCFIAQLTSTVAFLLFPLITRVDTTDEAEHKIYAAKVLLVAAFSLLQAQGSHIMI